MLLYGHAVILWEIPREKQHGQTVDSKLTTSLDSDCYGSMFSFHDCSPVLLQQCSDIR